MCKEINIVKAVIDVILIQKTITSPESIEACFRHRNKKVTLLSQNFERNKERKIDK